jgi:phosphohistidine phosphatase
MDLLLWRHADAEDGYPDSARALTRKGHAQADAAARWLTARLPDRYRLVASPAVRAQQTAAALGVPVETQSWLDVGAQAQKVLEAAGWGSGDGTLILVGHQPTLGRIASLLLSGNEAEWSVGKSCVWWFSGDEGDATLRAVFDPKLG